MSRTDFEFEAELNSLMKVLERSDLESEIAEFEWEAEFEPFRVARDLLVIGNQGGQRDENKLTDAIFYDRHPEWKGRQIKNASASLRQEWVEIRDTVVRPYLQNYPAVPPPPPQAPPPPAPQPAAPPLTATGEQFGFSAFQNTLNYEAAQYSPALIAQNAYQKVAGFLPYYKKISNAWPRVSISLAEHGVGNLIFSMDGRAFNDFVESEELRNKALEIMGGGVTAELFFTEDVIGMLGIGLTMIDLANGLNNEHMVGGVGPEYDKWRAKQQLQFTFGLAAEDLTRHNWGNLQFINRDARSLAVELANRYAEFRPIFVQYANAFNHEQDLARYQGNVPPPQSTMGPA